MTKEQASTIPEELYNLTQLAEVTLAAGRLSTTNIIEITDYINKKGRMDESNWNNSDQKLLLLSNMEDGDDADDDDDDNHSIHDLEATSLPFLTDVFEIKHSSSSTTSMMSQNNHDDADVKITLGQDDQGVRHRDKNSRVHFQTTSSSFCSSSDDDSNYYSHKIFDRKKLRRSTISDNSRYDELSCSSTTPPSCNGGDENNFCFFSRSNRKNSSTSTDSATGFMDDEHACPECGKKYSTSSNLARHRQTHRSISDKKARRCPHCEKVYVSMPAYSMHVRTHNQGCECKYCGKCFSRPWLLQGHIRTHTGEKPFKCTVCTKAFADKSNLRAHIQTHSNTKPHSCGRCGKSFALKSYLYKHEESSCMKNHNHHLDQKSEKEMTSVAIEMTTTTTTTAQATTTTTIATTECIDSAVAANTAAAKSTLASKLLQREKDRRRIITQTPLPMLLQPSLENTIIAEELHDFPNKSYATLMASTNCSSMSPDNYDHFNRISVIRAPIASSAIDLLPQHYHQQHHPEESGNSFYHQHHQRHHHHHQHHHLQQPPPPPPHHHCQDMPIDYAPKNNFSHSTKTSPFELTSNYAVVA